MLISNYIRYISRGLILLLIFFALQAAFLQPAAGASGTVITNVSVQPESFYTGSVSNYTFSFQPSTALSGDDTITIELPDGYSLSPDGIDEIYASSEEQPLEFTSRVEGQIVELVLNSLSSVNAGEVVEVIVELINPAFFGRNVFYMYTSRDQDLVSSEVRIIEESIPELKVTPYNTREVLKTPFLYTFEFTSMAPISNMGSNQITLTLPSEVIANAVKPPYGNDLQVEVPGNVATILEYTIDVASGTIKFTPYMTIPSLTPVIITIASEIGLMNPPTEGYKSFSIKTSGDVYETTNDYVYFHSDEGAKLGNVSVEEVFVNNTNYLQLDFTNHIDLHPSDYVQINFPHGFQVDPNPFETNATISIGDGTAVSTTASLTYSSLNMSIPERIKANTSSTIRIPIKENMSLKSRSFEVDVLSWKEMNPFKAPLVIEEKQVQYLEGVSTPNQAGMNSALTISFETNRLLIADESSIIVEFPGGVTLPNEVMAEEITINGEAVESVHKDNRTLIMTIPETVAKSEEVTIVFSQDFGITNPNVPGQYSYNVKVIDGNFNQFSSFAVLYNPAPSGGSSQEPSPTPEPIKYVSFVDLDGVAGTIDGVMQWVGPQDQTGIDSYSIFFIDSAGSIVSEIKNIPVNVGNRVYTVDIEDTAIPTNATRIGVRWNSGESHSEMVNIAIWDHPIQVPLELRFEDNNLLAGTINGELIWNKPPSESGISSYRIFYRTNNEDEVIALVPANGSASYSVTIPTEIAMNEAVIYMNMVNEHNEMGGEQYAVTMMDYTSASTVPSSTVRADLSAPEDVFYFDYNKEIGNQVGYIYWLNPNESSNITGYQLSYVMSDGTTQAFAQVKKRSSGQHKIYLSSMSNGPSGVITGVQSISIRSMDSEGNVSTPIIVDIEDQASSNYSVDNIQFYDFDMSYNEVAGTISWVHPSVVSLLTGYEIYFVDNYNRRISKIGAVSISSNQFTIPSNTIIPPLATRISIYSKGHVLLSIPRSIEITDSTWGTNYNPVYRSKMTSLMDVNQNGLEIDDVVKYLGTQYDMDGNNTFDGEDVYWMLGLLLPNQVPS